MYFNLRDASRQLIRDRRGPQQSGPMETLMESRSLKRRRNICSETEFAAIDSQQPYGIPIYSLIKSIEAKDLQEPPNKDVPRPKKTQSSQSSQRKVRKISKSSALLSEKYRANSFFDLVGNDDANRQMLQWITYWKSCATGTSPALSESTDILGRPLRKILLVHGPPGCGKTTAAHVIAKQAGFDILEINASDERGAAIVKDRIASALGSHRVDSRQPVCIIADEIEGASEQGFIRSLINLIKQDAVALNEFTKSKQSLHHATGPRTQKRTKKKSESMLLLRPIIAVCNDAWAASLRNLRPHAEMISFQRHPPARLLQRLEQICNDENLRLTSRELRQLAENSDFDMRACLNSLQFNSALSKQSASTTFTQHLESESAEKSSPNMLAKLQFLSPHPATFQQLEACSNLDKLVASCFTVYPDSSYVDDCLKKPTSMGDYLALADSRSCTDEVKALVPHAFGQLFRSPGISARDSTWANNKVFGKPPSHFEEIKQTKSIIDSMLKSSLKEVKTRVNTQVALLDLMPFAVRITGPTAVQSLSRPEDKLRMQLIAGCLQELGVDLRTEKLDNGSYIHRLEPPLELACVFGVSEQTEASLGNYVSRSQIKEALRDRKKLVNLHSNLGNSQNSNEHRSTPIKPVLPSTKVDIKEKVSDFFRPAAPVSDEAAIPKQLTDSNVTARDERVWILYTEGFSNAVRKPITWSELFGI